MWGKVEGPWSKSSFLISIEEISLLGTNHPTSSRSLTVICVNLFKGVAKVMNKHPHSIILYAHGGGSHAD